MAISTKLIEGNKPEAQTLLELQQSMGIAPHISIMMCVFEVTLQDKKVYACWSGGLVQDGQPMLNLVGRAALEALINLPLGTNDNLIFQELKIGVTPLDEKVKHIISQAPAGSKICFLGDLQGELDGHIAQAFNVINETVNILH